VQQMSASAVQLSRPDRAAFPKEGRRLMVLRLLGFIIGLLGIGSYAAVSGAPPQPSPSEGRRVHPRLIAEHLALTPGKRAWLALDFAIEPGWHMYWKGQNDTGLPPQIAIELPAEFKSGEILWPAPERHVSPGDLVDSVVHEQMTLLIPIDVPVNARPGGTVQIALKAEWLVCKDACVLEDASLSISLPIRDAMPAAEPDPKSTGIFAAARERLPRKLPKDNPPAAVEWRENQVLFSAPGATELVFHAEEGGLALDTSATDVAVKAARLEIRLKPPAQPGQRLLGVLEIRKGNRKPEYFTISLPPPGRRDEK